MADNDETTELTTIELEVGSQVGKTAGVIMAAICYDTGPQYATPAVAKRVREIALILHGAEEDEPRSES